MSSTPLHDEVRQLILRVIHLTDEEDAVEITDHLLLFECPELDLDSIDGLEIVTAIEKQYGVPIREEHQPRQVLRSVSSIVAFIQAARS